MAVDPLSDKYPHLNPYNYVGNNPLSNIDNDGRAYYTLGDKRISPREAYARTMVAISSFATNKIYGTDLSTNLNFKSKNNNVVDPFIGFKSLSFGGESSNLAEISGHNCNLLEVNTLFTAELNISDYIFEGEDLSSITFLSESGELLIKIDAESLDGLNAILKDAGMQVFKDEKSGEVNIRMVDENGNVVDSNYYSRLQEELDRQEKEYLKNMFGE